LAKSSDDYFRRRHGDGECATARLSEVDLSLAAT